MRTKLSTAGALLLALAGPATAQTLGELSAAMGAHHEAAAIGSGSASTAHQARDSITRHLPKQGGTIDDGEGRGAGPMRTARAGGHGSRGSWSGPGKGGGTRSSGGSWAGKGGDSRRKRR